MIRKLPFYIMYRGMYVDGNQPRAAFCMFLVPSRQWWISYLEASCVLQLGVGAGCRSHLSGTLKCNALLGFLGITAVLSGLVNI